MVLFGGECSQQQDENAPGRQNKDADSDDDLPAETVNALSLLEPDFNLWVDVPISGRSCTALSTLSHHLWICTPPAAMCKRYTVVTCHVCSAFVAITS